MNRLVVSMLVQDMREMGSKYPSATGDFNRERRLENDEYCTVLVWVLSF